jgi:deazaflavin-dependent oxidoreductase (nitroreductase family)
MKNIPKREIIMTVMDPVQVQRWRQGFKYLNKFMLSMWRLGLGNWMNIWPDVIGQIMVITHVGRRTGVHHKTPVNYAIVDGEVYCVSGFGEISDWYKNILEDPNVEVWLPDGWWAGIAEDISDHEQFLPLVREVMIGSGFAAWLAGLQPKRMSDVELERMTLDYKLIHIRRDVERTGPGGPGELSWIWPVIVFLAVPFLLRRRRKS